MHNTLKQLLHAAQRNEITEYHIYRRLAAILPAGHNRDILNRIAEDEHRHYAAWHALTKIEVPPSRFKVWRYVTIARLLGLTFGVKLMEGGEKMAQVNYDAIARELPDARSIREDEEQHEHELIKLIDEKKLAYIGSIVLGMNDALVELTGALAGFTLVLQNPHLIAVTGLITGIAASFSMAISEYLSTKAEGAEKNATSAAIYTGIAYVVTVMLLITPFLILPNVFISLAITLGLAVLIILGFTYYISVAKGLPFRKRFTEMALLSLGVAALSFGIGFLIKHFFNIEL